MLELNWFSIGSGDTENIKVNVLKLSIM